MTEKLGAVDATIRALTLQHAEFAFGFDMEGVQEITQRMRPIDLRAKPEDASTQSGPTTRPKAQEHKQGTSRFPPLARLRVALMSKIQASACPSRTRGEVEQDEVERLARSTQSHQ